MVMSEKLKNCIDKILEFHSTVSEAEGRKMEAHFNSYLNEVIGIEKTLIFLISTTQQGENKSEQYVRVKVLGCTILEEDILFKITKSSLHESLLEQKSGLLPTSNLYRGLRQRISLMIQIPEYFLCVPFVPKNEKLPGLLCCLMHSQNECVCVDGIHSVIVEYMLRYCGNTLSLGILQDENTRINYQNIALLSIADKLFHKIGNVQDLLKVIMIEARKLVNAERCSLFLVDKKQGMLRAKVFEGSEDLGTGKPVTIHINQGIAGNVAVTGKSINVPDVYKEPLFYRKIDQISGFKTRNMLCIPIQSGSEVLAVAQLCNKIGQPYFSYVDEEICGPFVSYCGISIKHTLLYEAMSTATARQRLTNELMIYHLGQQVDLADNTSDVFDCTMDHLATFHYDQFSCSPLNVDQQHMICILYNIFTNFGFLEKFDIPKTTLVRFLLYMKNGYRDNPYHNWLHAFSVVHFAYLEIIHFHLIEDGYFNLLEVMAILVACLGHDIDHRGTTNSFESSTGTVLASLYSSQGSVMERHHFQQTMCILHLEECNIFDHLTREEYTCCVEIINKFILATDLATHLRNKGQYRETFQQYQKENQEHKVYLLSIIATSCDLNMQTKEWTSVRQTAKTLYEEFFRQGDLEFAMGIPSSVVTDRHKAKIPQQQVEFISGIVAPVFQDIALLFPSALHLSDRLNFNMKCWQCAISIFAKRLERGDHCIHILDDTSFDKEVLDSVYPEENF